MAYKDILGALGNALGPLGAVSGGILGSVIPGLGNTLGATAGGALGSLAGSGINKLLSSGNMPQPGLNQWSALTPEQRNVQTQSLNQALSLLQGNGAPGFAPIAERARHQYKTQARPGLAERLTSMGLRRGDASYEHALNQSSADLESQLAALESGYNQNQLSMLLGYGLRPSFENILVNEGPGFSDLFGAELLQALPTLLAQHPQLMGGNPQKPSYNLGGQA